MLKGLHKAPRIENYGIGRSTVNCLISPHGVIGRPHKACFDAGIPVITVKENKTAFNFVDDRVCYVENYLEAAGVVACMKAGVNPQYVRAQRDCVHDHRNI